MSSARGGSSSSSKRHARRAKKREQHKDEKVSAASSALGSLSKDEKDEEEEEDTPEVASASAAMPKSVSAVSGKTEVTAATPTLPAPITAKLQSQPPTTAAKIIPTAPAASTSVASAKHVPTTTDKISKSVAATSSISSSSSTSSSSSSSSSSSGLDEKDDHKSGALVSLKRGDLAPMKKAGNVGENFQIISNFFRLSLSAGAVYKWLVMFNPDIPSDSQFKRRREFSPFQKNILKEVFGGFTYFNITHLYTLQSPSESKLRTFFTTGKDSKYYFVEPFTNTQSFTMVNKKKDGSVMTVSLTLQQEIDTRKGERSDVQVVASVMLKALLESERFGLARIRNDFFDFEKKTPVPDQHNYDFPVWLVPGFKVTVNVSTGGFSLVCDVIHLSLQIYSVAEIIEYAVGETFQSEPRARVWLDDKFSGRTVYMTHSKDVLRADYIDWEKSLDDRFDWNGKQISYRQYFKERYGISLKQTRKGMLARVRGRAKNVLGTERKALATRENALYYPLELAHSIGVIDEKDVRLMKWMKDSGRKPPKDRLKAIQELPQKIAAALATSSSSSSSSSAASAKGSGDTLLSIASDMTGANARCLPLPTLTVNEGRLKRVTTNNIRSAVQNAKPMKLDGTLFSAGSITQYGVIYPEDDVKRWGGEFDSWLAFFQQNAQAKMSTSSALKASKLPVRDKVAARLMAIAQERPQPCAFYVVLLPLGDASTPFYSTVKSIFVAGGVHHSCIKIETLSGRARNDATLGFIDQIMVKLNGRRWFVEPASTLKALGVLNPALASQILGSSNNKTMVVAADVCHDRKFKDAYRPETKSEFDAKERIDTCAFVSSYDVAFSAYFAQVHEQRARPGWDLIEKAKEMMKVACEEFRKKNAHFPEHILVYRDGVGDSQMAAFVHVEQICYRAAFRELNISPKLTVVVVQKRVGARFWTNSAERETAKPGTVVDTGIVSDERTEWFMVSCTTPRNANAVPTRYVVACDDNNFSLNELQEFTYHLCYCYFIFHGSLKVPLPVQLADNLSWLHGKFINLGSQKIADVLATNLYYI